MNDRKQFLIIGCGKNDKNSHEMLLKKISHKEIHPDDLFDTLDISKDANPTFSFDINNTEIIKSEFKETYQLVILERFPADYFNEKTATSIKHLANKEGMVVFMPTGTRIALFEKLISTMRDVSFNKCIVFPEVNLILYFDTESNDNVLKIVNHFINTVPYVAQLFTTKGLMDICKNPERIILSKSDLQKNIRDSAILCKEYQDLQDRLGKKPSLTQIKTLLAIQPSLDEKKEGCSDLALNLKNVNKQIEMYNKNLLFSPTKNIKKAVDKTTQDVRCFNCLIM